MASLAFVQGCGARLTCGAEYGREKQESLNGGYLQCLAVWFRLTNLGLSDKDIEDKVTGLVKKSI